MGWTYTARPHDKSIAEFLRSRFECSNDSGSWKIVRDSLVGRCEYYALFRRTYPDGRITHFLGVMLVKAGKREIGWKDMTDAMGPTVTRCPIGILDLADELAPCTPEYDHHGWARAWREHCRRWHDNQRAAPKPGARVRFETPIRFTNGAELAEFEIVKGRRKLVFRDDGGQLYRITGWRQLPYRIVRPAAPQMRTVLN